MQIAKVRGTVVSTVKEESLRGVKFVLVQFIDDSGEVLPVYEVAADNVGAGVGEWVLISRGSGARQVPNGENRPVDAAVIGIIDTVSVDNRSLYNKATQY
jgi:carbon dioxide concentrating mechanism protein CcmL